MSWLCFYSLLLWQVLESLGIPKLNDILSKEASTARVHVVEMFSLSLPVCMTVGIFVADSCRIYLYACACIWMYGGVHIRAYISFLILHNVWFNSYNWTRLFVMHIFCALYFLESGSISCRPSPLHLGSCYPSYRMDAHAGRYRSE